MKKYITIFYCSFITLTGQTQKIDGVYKALELSSFQVDTFGNISFYRQNLAPKEYWFHEVEIKIQGTKITIEKSPVFFEDSKKVYSASDGGFLTYKGTLTKNDDVYFAKTQLIDCDYIGMSHFTPPKITDDNDTVTINRADTNTSGIKNQSEFRNLEKFKSANGIIYLQKRTIRKDFIIRQTKEGLWVNNQLFYPVKKSQLTIPKL